MREPPRSPFTSDRPEALGLCAVLGGIAVDDHVVDDAVFLGFLGGHEVITLHVLRDFLHLLASVLRHDLLEPPLEAIVSRAWISMSVACPWKPPQTWWIRILAFGRATRFPFAPPARMTAPIDIAIPTQVVWMSGLTYCIVS